MCFSSKIVKFEDLIGGTLFDAYRPFSCITFDREESKLSNHVTVCQGVGEHVDRSLLGSLLSLSRTFGAERNLGTIQLYDSKNRSYRS